LTWISHDNTTVSGARYALDPEPMDGEPSRTQLVANSIDAANDGDSRGIAIYGVLPQ
jgi:hypothetical protein